MTIALKKITAALRLNQRLVKAMSRQYSKLIVKAERVIKRNMIKWWYRQLFRKKKIFLATLYLETQSSLVKPNSKVQVFGNFTLPKPWGQKIVCVYDPKTKCFKTSKPHQIKQGLIFKFILDDGKAYITSTRYASHKDAGGIDNNVWDPKKINYQTVKKARVIEHSRAVVDHPQPQPENA